MLSLLWRRTRGYCLRPWRSPYLGWRVETYWGVPAETIAPTDFWRFAWRQRRRLAGYLRWAGKMRQKTRIAG
jgi:hypothetical protein